MNPCLLNSRAELPQLIWWINQKTSIEKEELDVPGIDLNASHMLSKPSTIWAPMVTHTA